MKYKVENYIATKIPEGSETLQKVVNGSGVVEGNDVTYTNGFLVWNETTKVVEHCYFNPARYEMWNGKEIVEDTERKLADEKFASERRKDHEFKTNGRMRVEISEGDIVLTQEALNFIIFGAQAPAQAKLRSATPYVETNGMAAYLASQVIKKANIDLQSGKDFYKASIDKYPEMKVTIDAILTAKGYQEIIE